MRAVVATLIGAALIGCASIASATDVQACLAASEKGQRARSAGKLREAREHFVVCGGETCPGLVRHDCAQWNSELASTLPTVVFGAKDNQGRDLFDVVVVMDGETIVKKLDGKSVTVDPGKHTFRFETAGYPPITETALVKEGERARVFNITFVAEAKTPPTRPPDTIEPTPSGGHTMLPWIVVGVGAVAVAAGIVIVVTTPDRPANCNESTKKCQKTDGENDEDLKKDQERAGTADSQPILGFAVTGIGAALVIGGVVWHFLEPTKPAAARLRVTPWMTGQSSAGVALGGTF